MNKALLLLLAPVLFVAFSCNKSKHNDPIGNRQEMIKNTTWRVVEMRDNGEVIPLGCKADDRWIFPDGARGILEEGAESCTEYQNTTFNYGISGDQRDFWIWEADHRTSYGSYVAESIRFKWKIVYMTNNELDVEYYYPGEPGEEQHYYELVLARVL